MHAYVSDPRTCTVPRPKIRDVMDTNLAALAWRERCLTTQPIVVATVSQILDQHALQIPVLSSRHLLLKYMVVIFIITIVMIVIIVIIIIIIIIIIITSSESI